MHLLPPFHALVEDAGVTMVWMYRNCSPKKRHPIFRKIHMKAYCTIFRSNATLCYEKATPALAPKRGYASTGSAFLLNDSLFSLSFPGSLPAASMTSTLCCSSTISTCPGLLGLILVFWMMG